MKAALSGQACRAEASTAAGSAADAQMERRKGRLRTKERMRTSWLGGRAAPGCGTAAACGGARFGTRDGHASASAERRLERPSEGVGRPADAGGGEAIWGCLTLQLRCFVLRG